MPTPRKTTAAPAKKAPAKRAPKKATTPVPPRPSNDGPNVSGIAAKRAQMRGDDARAVDAYAPTAWGATEAEGTLTDLDLPSGQKILAQRPGPMGLMQSGMLNDLDMLSGILPKIMGGKSSKKSQEFDARQLMKSPEMIKQAMDLMNRVLVHVVIKPELTPEPEDPSDREVGKIYPSSVAMEDKTFIFNWAVGGTRDLTRFREQHAESMAGLEAQSVAGNPS